MNNLKVFLQKFFGFYEMDNGEMWGYNDNLGYGNFWDTRYILWIVITIILSFIFYQFCKKYKEKGDKMLKELMVVMIVLRIFLQLIKSYVGYSLPRGRDLVPGQMCTILIYLLPLTVIFNLEKIYTPVCVLSMMGSFMTFLLGDYFESRFLSFYTLEGIWAHTMLWVVPFGMMGLGKLKLDKKNIWKVIVMMLVMIAWATFLNKVVFIKYHSNYFYLENNVLPGKIGGKYFILVYTAIFFTLLLSIYIVPVIYKKIVKLFIKDNEKLKKKINIIILISVIIFSQILMMYVKDNRNTKFSTEEKNINLALVANMLSDFSVDYDENQIQDSLNNIRGENDTKVYKGLTGIKVKFLETGNVYNIRDSKANIKAVIITKIVHKWCSYIFEAILIINLIIIIAMIYKSNRKSVKV